MYHVIFGAPGAGKSSLLTHFLERRYFEQGREMLSRTREKIKAINERYGTNYTAPDAPPIFADYDVRLHVGFEEYYEPYFINGFYFGLPNDTMQKMQFVPPGSVLFLSEVQRYYNSRKSQSLPDWVSRAYEMHRHFDIEVYMDIQRPALVDLNIRELCKHFIEVLKMKHVKDKLGRVIQTKFYCREFESWLDVEQYQKNGEKTYTETTYTHNGNIFNCFNSFSCEDVFLPRVEKGEDFIYMPSERRAKEECIESVFYSKKEPKEYRSKA